MNATQRLMALRERIPAMECIDGCTDCCGPVPVNMVEIARIEHKRGRSGGIDCQYATGGRCMIYENRPVMCRLFGAVDTPMLECPHGRHPLQRLSTAEADEILREYRLLGKVEIL